MQNKGYENLVPATPENAAERGRLGGIKSGQVRRARKTLREELLLLLETGERQERISLSLIQQALDGNTKAYEIIRDTIGEKPKDVVEQKSEIKVTMDSDINEWGK